MTRVSSKELKNRLGRYLRLVRSGRPVQVTGRGRIIACILPTSSSEERQTARLLASLVAKGGIRLGTGKLRPRPRPTVLKPGKSIAAMVAEDRR